MKTLEYLLFIIFILSNAGVKGSSFSIDTLLDYLQENQYYEIIFQVKLAFGDDIAISVCKSLIATNQCEEVVRVYMDNDDNDSSSSSARRAPSNRPKEEDLCPNAKTILLKVEIPQSNEDLIIYVLKYYDILSQDMNEDEIIQLIERILGIRPIILISNKDLLFKIEKYKKKQLEIEK